MSKCLYFSATEKQFKYEGDFPDVFGPIGLHVAESVLEHVELLPDKTKWKMKQGEVQCGCLSAFSSITFNEFERAELGIPPSSTTFAWCYQSPGLHEKYAAMFTASSDKAFLKNGGFIYLDNSGNCDRVLAATDTADGCMDLTLGAPTTCPPDKVKRLRKEQRFFPVTIPRLVKRGAQEYAWLLPGDVSEHGGFAYIVSQCDEVSEPSSAATLCQCSWLPMFSEILPAKPTQAAETEPPQKSDEFNLADAIKTVSLQLPAGPRVCILGGRKFQEPTSELVVKELAKAFATELKNKAVVLTGGLEGIQETFATNLGLPDHVVNMVPAGESSHFSVGKEIKGGSSLKERIAIYGEIGDIYLTIEGGPGVSKEAGAAATRGAVVLPIIWTGGASGGMFDFPSGALQKPDFFSTEEWKQLQEKTKEDPAELAQSTAKIVIGAIVKLIDQRRFDRRPS